MENNKPLEPGQNQTTSVVNPVKPTGEKFWIVGTLVFLMALLLAGLYRSEILDFFNNSVLQKKAIQREINPENNAVNVRGRVGLPIPTQTSDGSKDVKIKNKLEQEVWLEVGWLPALLEEKCLDGLPSEKCYKVGTITSEILKNQDLYMQLVPSMGGVDFVYYTKKEGVKNVLPGYPEFGKNAVYKFKGVDDVPEYIDLKGSSYKLQKGGRDRLFSEVKIKFVVFEHNIFGPIYLDQNNCLVAQLPNHTAIAYNLVLPFVNAENGEMEITYSDNRKVKERYEYYDLSCDSKCLYLKIQDEAVLKPQERLQVVGILGNGEKIYEFSDPNAKELKELYNDKNTLAYMTGDYNPTEQSKYSYQEFLNLKPLLFWQDPLGRWVKFHSAKFIPAAEMCKPVIYLYPEKKTDLLVKVKPNGGFTYTEPPYGEGWEVEAAPDGSILDKKTGKAYPYLFWEGMGLNYPVSKTGWAVKSSEIKSFFAEILPKLGLRGREQADFMEYWVLRLQDQPFYKISFLTQAEFDTLAPLEISGAKPQTIVRVMMTAQPLASYEDIAPQELPETPIRKGFTVIEWGGVLLR